MRTKIFLTSAMIMMVLCPAFATQGQIDSGVTTTNCSGDPLYFQGTERTSGTLTYTAQWTANKYSVIYAKGDHAANNVNDYTDTNSATYGQDYTALGASTTGVSAATGYVFLGYIKSGTPQITRTGAITGTLTNAWTGETPWAIADDLTVTAAYMPKQYTVTYDCNGGTKKSGVSSLVDTNGATYGLPYTFWDGTNTCEKSGSDFSGWNCVITGTSTTVNQNTNATSWAVDDNVTCSAQWGAHLINLRWEPAGGTPSSITMPQTCSYGTANGISDITQPTKTGYTFTGWKVTNWTE